MTDFSKLDSTGGVGAENAQTTIDKGYPPIAENTFLIDFDNCLAPFGFLFGFPTPFEGGPEFTQALKAKGHRIGIFTSRLSPEWLESADQNKQDHIDYITEYCQRYNITFDFITATKVPAIAYFDDRAVECRGNWIDMFVKSASEGWI